MDKDIPARIFGMSQIPDSIHLPLYGLLQALKCAATQNPSFTLLVAASSALLIIFSRRKTGNAAFEAPSIDRSIAVLARLDFFRHGKDIIERGCREVDVAPNRTLLSALLCD